MFESLTGGSKAVDTRVTHCMGHGVFTSLYNNRGLCSKL